MLQCGAGKPGIPPTNSEFTPSDDFYLHVNNKWLKQIELPPYENSYGVSEEIDDDVRNQLLKLIEKHRQEKPHEPLSKIATSFLHYPHQKNSLIMLNQILGKLNCLKTVDDIGFTIGDMNRIQAKSPMALIVSGDSYKTSDCRVYLYETSLGLASKRYYFVKKQKGVEMNNILTQYSNLMKKIGDLLLQSSLESFILIEKKIIPCLSRYSEQSDIRFSYNPFSLKELKEKYKGIPWDSILRGWGMPETVAKNTTFIITNKRYFKTLENMFKVFSLEAWKTWFRGLAVLSFLEFLPPPYDDLHFNFFGKLLKGSTQKLPQKYLMLKVLQKFCPQDLGRFFVKHAVPKETKPLATKMIKSLKEATIARLDRLSWLEDATKKEAIRKVADMKFQVAYPEKWESESEGCNIFDDQPLANIIELNIKNTQTMLSELKTGICERSEEKWDDGVFEVNAYYYSEGNMMVIPAGILRSPFFDVNKSMAWNLGGIGAAIGHEITHGFDTDGRMYDAAGNYKNWWSKTDERKYNKLTKKVVELFDKEKYMDGEIDGELTLSENLADVGGMAIALEALNKTLDGEKAGEKEKKSAYVDFFKSYAISWRNKDRPQKARDSLFSDSHAPAKFRVNKIVQQFPEFYIAFNINKGDEGWIEPEDRIVLW